MSDVKLCRACLSSIASVQYYLFENVSADIFLFCTSIVVTQEEAMPKSICNVCYDKLLQFNEFKSNCIQSHEILLNNKYLQLSKNIKIGEDLSFQTKKEPLDETFQDVCFESIITPESNVKDHIQDEHVDNSSDHEIPTFAAPLKSSNKLKNEGQSILKLLQSGKSFICEICGRKFLSAKRLQTHTLNHETKLKPLQCTPCNKKFVTWYGLKRHNTTWHARISLTTVKCRTCGKVTKSRDSLRAHEKLHSKRQTHICNICGKVYSTAFGLKTHLETHQENRERQCTCEYCGKKFFTKKTLSSHVNRCHTGRRYICQICNYPFTDKYNLAQHLLIHEGKKLYKCKICEKSFSTRFTFEEHQRIHSGERPFSCSYCSKNFLSKKRLNEHHRTHTGEKPHKCNVCARSFTQRGTLKRHMKIHDKIIPLNEKYFEQRV